MKVVACVLEETEVDYFLVGPEMLPARVAEPDAPGYGPARVAHHVLAAIGLSAVLTIGSQLADEGVAHHRGDDASGASHQRDLGISSSYHTYSLGI